MSKHCFTYCGDDRCNCDAAPPMTTSPKITEAVERLERDAHFAMDDAHVVVRLPDLRALLADREALEQENARLAGECERWRLAFVMQSKAASDAIRLEENAEAREEAEKARADRLAEALKDMTELFDSSGALFCSGDWQLETVAKARQALAAFDTSRPDDAEGGDA